MKLGDVNVRHANLHTYLLFKKLFDLFEYAGFRIYRDRLKGVQILLSRTQAGPGRTVKQEQEEASRNHVQTF